MKSIERPRAALAALVLAGCASTSIRVPVDDRGLEYREVQKLDCGVYDERTRSLTVGLNLSLLFGTVQGGPSVTSAETVGMKWDRSVQGIVAQYKELCSRFNGGALSQTAYAARLAEIDQLHAEAAGIRRSAEDLIRARSQTAFADLDRETGDQGSAPSEQVASSIDTLYNRAVRD
jgi:hypothetical protein